MNEITIGFVKQAGVFDEVRRATGHIHRGIAGKVRQHAERMSDAAKRDVLHGRFITGLHRAERAERLHQSAGRVATVGMGLGAAAAIGGTALAVNAMRRKKEAGVVSTFARAGRRAEGQIAEVQRLRQKGVPFGDAMRRAARKGAKIKSMMSSGAGAAATHAPDTAARGKILARRTGHASAKETLTRRLSK